MWTHRRGCGHSVAGVGSVTLFGVPPIQKFVLSEFIFLASSLVARGYLSLHFFITRLHKRFLYFICHCNLQVTSRICVGGQDRHTYYSHITQYIRIFDVFHILFHSSVLSQHSVIHKTEYIIRQHGTVWGVSCRRTFARFCTLWPRGTLCNLGVTFGV